MASLLVTLLRVFIALNLALLVGLLYVWVDNYRQLRSKHALGLVLFAGFLFGENLLAAYYFIVHPTVATQWLENPDLVPPIAQQAMLALRVLEFGGLVFLSWVTWD